MAKIPVVPIGLGIQSWARDWERKDPPTAVERTDLPENAVFVVFDEVTRTLVPLDGTVGFPERSLRYFVPYTEVIHPTLKKLAFRSLNRGDRIPWTDPAAKMIFLEVFPCEGHTE